MVWEEMTVNEIRCAIEYREDEARQGPGRIVGTLMVYGDPRQGTGPKMFSPGALRWPDAGIILNEQHNRQAPIHEVYASRSTGKKLRH